MRDSEHSSKFLTIRLPWWSLAPLLLLLVQFLEFLSNDFQVSGNTLDDADTLMRLAWLRSAQANGLWHGEFFDRNGAPYGMFLHWTLPFNLIVLGIGKLFWFLPPDGQLQQAGFWTGPFLRVGIAFAAYWAGRQMLSRPAAFFATCMILFSPYMLNYADQGSANHHPLLYLDTVLAVGFAGALAKYPLRPWPAIGAGVVAGFCLWCSFELVIVAGLLFAWMFGLWIAEGRSRTRQLRQAAAAFAATDFVALLLDPPDGHSATVVYDHISLPLLCIASLPLAVTAALLFVPAASLRSRLMGCSAVSLVFAMLYLLAWPGVIAGVEGGMDPYVKTEWLSDIGEVRPITEGRKIVLYLGPTLLAILMVPLIVRRPLYRVALGALLAAAFTMGLLHYRFSGYTAIATAFALAAAAQHMAGMGRAGRIAALLGCFALAGSYYAVEMLNSVFAIDLQHPATGAVGNQNQVDDEDNDGGSCDPYDVADALNDDEFLAAKPDAIIMADINMTPKILYWTHDRTVAGNYHRDNHGIKDNYLFFRALDDAAAKAIAQARGIDFVLICSTGDNADYAYSSTARARAAVHDKTKTIQPENTLYTRLVNGDPPPWLKLRDWPDDTDSSLLLYQVVPEAMKP